MKTIKDIAQKYVQDFIEGNICDTQAIFNFLDTNEVTDYIGGEIMKVRGEDLEAFDVFYEAQFGEKSFNISVEFIEYLNEIDDIDLIALELIAIAERIKASIFYIDNYLKKCEK